MLLRKPRRHPYLALILVVSFALLAGLYSIVTPLWEAPDEFGHFRFIHQILETGRLPEQEPGVMIQAHHPPLYYLIASFFAAPAKLGNSTGAYRANPNFIWSGGDEVNVSFHHTEETFPYRGLSLTAHLARAASIFMSSITVLLIIAIGWQIFPEQREIGLLAAALVAFNPQFLFINSSINNDALLALATTGILWQAIRIWEKTGKLGHRLQLGLWIAVALLARLSSVVLATVAIVFLALGAWRGRTWRPFIRGALVTSSVIIILTGWWFIRNQLLVR
jgi:4-amino-4-deoxy-L-arabinose transferase-like glycosyltransferase